MLSCRSTEASDLEFLTRLYADQEVRTQLYSAPINQGEFAQWMLRPHRYIVERSRESIGTFTLIPTGITATLGIAIDRKHRGQSYIVKVNKLIEAKAKKLGIQTIVADIYSDNQAAIRLAQHGGFREFLWFEKNIK